MMQYMDWVSVYESKLNAMFRVLQQYLVDGASHEDNTPNNPNPDGDSTTYDFPGMYESFCRYLYNHSTNAYDVYVYE